MGCDSLSEISFGGSKEAWELLTGGTALTLERSDSTLFTPTVHFLSLNDTPVMET